MELFRFLCVLIPALSFVTGQSQVDETRVAGANGSSVVEATLELLDKFCLFPDDKLFMRRIAKVETNDGQTNTNNGGIWGLVEAKYEELKEEIKKDARIADKLEEAAKDLGISKTVLATIKYANLDVPLYSALAARMFIYAKNMTIPRSTEGQADLWISNYQSAGKKSDFITAANELQTGCNIRGIDLTFVLDGSGSIGRTNFEEIKRFTINITKDFTIGQNRTRVGVIVFSSRVGPFFYLNKYNDAASLQQTIQSLRYPHGGTRTYYALSKVYGWYTRQYYGVRPKADGFPRVIVVLTDGRSSNKRSTIASADLLHKEEIIVFSIGVGGSLDPKELSAIASDPDCQHQFLINNFKEVSHLKAAIEKRACQAPVILSTSSNISDQLPSQSSQYCKLKVSQNGVTVKITSKSGKLLKFYTSSKAFPSSALFDTMTLADGSTRVSVYIPYNSSNPNAVVFCSIVNPNSSPGGVEINVVDGNEAWCQPHPCKNGGKCIEKTTTGYTCQCRKGYGGLNCQSTSLNCPTCENGGKCVTTSGVGECKCTVGYYGNSCEYTDHCHKTPCWNGGQCERKQNYYTCKCLDGFHGYSCEYDDACSSDPCENNGICSNNKNSYDCVCKRGFSGTNCENKQCSLHCFNRGVCKQTNGVSTCVCTPGYRGTTCLYRDYCYKGGPCRNGATCALTGTTYKCTCAQGYYGRTCTTKDACTSDPCKNNGTCKQYGHHYSCSCPSGFSGKNCDERKCVPPCFYGRGRCESINGQNQCVCKAPYYGNSCQDQDRCVSSPCKNGGKCIRDKSRYTCDCASGYHGYICQYKDACASLPCQNKGTCKRIANIFRCTCTNGYYGRNCEKINACSSSPCKNQGRCIQTTQSYRCWCASGYTGTNCQQKRCKVSCMNGGVCQEINGVSKCVCKPGYHGSRCSYKDACFSSPCNNQAPCVRQGHSYKCDCPSGYTGTNCDQKDACASLPCKNKGTCKQIANTFSCTCTNGYYGRNCEKKDACFSSPCKNQAPCVRQGQSYKCDCPSGYTGTNCDQKDKEDEEEEGYDCEKNSPCTDANIAARKFYHSHTDPKKFIQCDEWGQCFNMDCAGGTEWSQKKLTCDHVVKFFDCQGRNPCTDDSNIKKGLLYHQHKDRHHYIQCGQYGQCWVQKCATGLVWKQSAKVCDWP